MRKSREKALAFLLALLAVAVLFGAASGQLRLVYPTGMYEAHVDRLGVSRKYLLCAEFSEGIPLSEEEALECNKPFTGYYTAQPLFTGTVKFYQDGNLIAEETAEAAGLIWRDQNGKPLASIRFVVPADRGVYAILPPVEGYKDPVTGRIVVTKEPTTTIKMDLIGYFKGRQVVTDSGSFKIQVKYIGEVQPTPTPTPPAVSPPTSPPPKPIDLWSLLQLIWSRFVNWLKTIFGLSISTGRLTVVTGDIVHPGDTYKHTFTLMNTKSTVIPDKDYNDGTASYLYALWMVTDANGNIIHKGDVTEVASLNPGATITYTAEWNVPSNIQDGKYAVVYMLVEIPMHWDRTTQKWIQDEPVIIDKQGVEVNVQTIPPPPAPPATDVWTTLQQWIQSIIDWLRSLFGL